MVTRQYDFSLAYLNGDLPSEPPVYMHQPTGFAKQGEEDKVCLMHKPLYGMVQAGHIWYKELENNLEAAVNPEKQKPKSFYEDHVRTA